MFLQLTAASKPGKYRVTTKLSITIIVLWYQDNDLAPVTCDRSYCFLAMSAVITSVIQSSFVNVFSFQRLEHRRDWGCWDDFTGGVDRHRHQPGQDPGPYLLLLLWVTGKLVIHYLILEYTGLGCALIT